MSESKSTTSGIYCIRCIPTGKVYIGHSARIARRLSSHRWQLKTSRHPNPHLQAAWSKYGEDVFVFEILERVEIPNLVDREDYYISLFSSNDGRFGFNIREAAGSNLGCKMPPVSPERRARLSAASTGKRVSEETRRKLSLIRSQYKASEETRAKQRAAICGRKHTPEAIARMSQVQRGRVVSEETRRILSEAHRGKPLTDKHRACLANRKPTPESNTKRAEAMRGKRRSPEAIERSAAKRRGAKRTPEQCARIVAGRMEARSKRREQGAASMEARETQLGLFDHEQETD